MVFVDGISFIPNQGIHTQNIPPITSVSDNKVSSAAGIIFEPIEYNIRPKHTIVPCVAKRASFLLEESIGRLLYLIIIKENKQQNRPAIATVVNFGVFFLHLRETVNPAKPNDESNPFNKPNKVPSILLSNDMKIIPAAAIVIAINVVFEIFSFKKTYAKIAATKG